MCHTEIVNCLKRKAEYYNELKNQSKTNFN